MGADPNGSVAQCESTSAIVAEDLSKAYRIYAKPIFAAAGLGSPQYGPIPSASPRAEPGVERFNRYDPRLAR